jgi:hypothetical protein
VLKPSLADFARTLLGYFLNQVFLANAIKINCNYETCMIRAKHKRG